MAEKEEMAQKAPSKEPAATSAASNAAESPRSPKASAEAPPLPKTAVEEKKPERKAAESDAKRAAAAPKKGETQKNQAKGGEALDSIEYMSEILLLLDTYDDIFSDFDPRPFSEREFSEDFIKELGRRHLTNRKGGLEVRFLVPSFARDGRTEAMIKRRLREHFEMEGEDIGGRLRKRRGVGAMYVATGLAFLTAELLAALNNPDLLWPQVAGMILVPAGWFFVWNGFERLIEDPENLVRDQQLNEKMSRCNFIFVSRQY